jgi:hypothetical protein
MRSQGLQKGLQNRPLPEAAARQSLHGRAQGRAKAGRAKAAKARGA